MDVEEIAKSYYRAKNKKEVKHYEKKEKKVDEKVENEEVKENSILAKEEEDNDDDYTDIDDSGDEKSTKERKKRKWKNIRCENYYNFQKRKKKFDATYILNYNGVILFIYFYVYHKKDRLK